MLDARIGLPDAVGEAGCGSHRDVAEALHAMCPEKPPLAIPASSAIAQSLPESCPTTVGPIQGDDLPNFNQN